MTSRPLTRPLALPCAAGLLMLAACTDREPLSAVGADGLRAAQVTATSAATLVPGRTVTLSGRNFHPVPDSNTVRIGGVEAAVTGGSATALEVVVPCAPSGPAAVQVDHGGGGGVPVQRIVQVPRRTLAVGEAVVLSGAGEADCNEITASGGDARYVLAVYNATTDSRSSAGFRLSDGGPPLGGPAHLPPRAAQAPSLPQAAQEDERHLRIMEMNRREHARLRARFAGDARMRARASTAASAGPPPAKRTIRVADVNLGSCDTYHTVSATRVYYDGRIAIYEDDATAAWLKAAANPAMQAYYNAIGNGYNTEMDPLLRGSFGDPLLRDASTDGNGILVALFTPLLNNAFGNVPAFVLSCDFFPNGEGNSASNHGEFVYAYQPTVNGTGYAALTPESWYWNIRGGLVHEAKHIASFSARVAADAWFEEPWLEEGTARHAEELWARSTIYNVGWRANTGYGSDAVPNSIYCDLRRTSSICLAASPARPAVAMYRHFQGLTAFMRTPADHSPFGPTAAVGNTSYFTTSWSLVRYAIDRYGASDADFLGALTSSTATGMDNLAAVAGVSIEELMGGWALALYADDFPGVNRPSPVIQMPTWNFRDIYTGLHADYRNAFPTPYPIVPQALPFGAFGTVQVPAVAGGGVAYFELSGTHTRTQLLRLQSLGDGGPASTLRMSIARLR